MRKTENRRKKVQMPAGIRQKMMAAVSMLMVSCIMMVSSTYAWFTLSTAPEVTGITTNVGANGNLEIALLDEKSYMETSPDLGIVSGINDSMDIANKDVKESNKTWGNLVNLDQYYGLEKLVLSPARLNFEDSNGTSIGTTTLMAPSYGTDGRVIEIDKATYSGKYDGTKDFLLNESHYGVRAFGTTTQITERTAAYRSAKAATSTTAVQTVLTNSLRKNAQTLANVLVRYASADNGNAVKIKNSEVRAIYSIIQSLDGANEKIVSIIKNSVLAHSLSDAQNKVLTDEEVDKLVEDIEAIPTISLEAFQGVSNALIPGETELTNAISAYNTVKNTINTTKTGMVNNGKLGAILNDTNNQHPDETEEVTYADIASYLENIIDKNYATVAGSEPTKDNIDEIINAVWDTKTVPIAMGDNSGVYASIAEIIGNYSASGIIVSVEAMGLTINNATVNMSTNVTKEPSYIALLVIGDEYDEGDAIGNAKLSNTYGYAIDFGFRTNAATSDLLLQTTPLNRVYTDNLTATNIQGEGSYMQFVSSDIERFSAQDVLGLMSAMRVVFVTPSSSGADVLGVAAMNITRTIDASGLPVITIGKNAANNDVATVVKGNDGTTDIGYKAELQMFNYQVDAEGKLQLLAPKAAGAEGSKIIALNQNEAAKVTAIVYIDGDLVDNTMAANAESSMTGKLNLQFSSSAALTPMENTSMRAGGVANITENTN